MTERQSAPLGKEKIEVWKTWLVKHSGLDSQRVEQLCTICDMALASLSETRPTYPGLWDDAALGQACEGMIALKTHFTGEPPYVGNEGVLLALREALDELNRLKALPSAIGAQCCYPEECRKLRRCIRVDDHDKSLPCGLGASADGSGATREQRADAYKLTNGIRK